MVHSIGIVTGEPADRAHQHGQSLGQLGHAVMVGTRYSSTPLGTFLLDVAENDDGTVAAVEPDVFVFVGEQWLGGLVGRLDEAVDAGQHVVVDVGRKWNQARRVYGMLQSATVIVSSELLVTAFADHGIATHVVREARDGRSAVVTAPWAVILAELVSAE